MYLGYIRSSPHVRGSCQRSQHGPRERRGRRGRRGPPGRRGLRERSGCHSGCHGGPRCAAKTRSSHGHGRADQPGQQPQRLRGQESVQKILD